MHALTAGFAGPVPVLFAAGIAAALALFFAALGRRLSPPEGARSLFRTAVKASVISLLFSMAAYNAGKKAAGMFEGSRQEAMRGDLSVVRAAINHLPRGP